MSVDNELGRHLQLVQGLHWLYAAGGDPYASLLRGFDDDLRPVGGALRERGRFWESRTGTLVTARHREGTELIAHPALGARRTGAQPALQQVMTWDRDLADLEPGDAVRPEEPRPAPDVVRARYEQAFAAVEDEFDVVEVAERVAVDVVADLFDLSAPQRARLAGSAGDVVVAADSLLCPQRFEASNRMLAALEDLREVFDGRAPGVLHAVLGVRMSADLVTKAVRASLADRNLWAGVAEEPARAAPVVEETLRYDPPVQIHVANAQRAFVFAGRDVPIGTQVAVVLTAANRDPEVFADPDRFDAGRGAAPGAGPLTPGAPYARLLPFARVHAEAALVALGARFPELRVRGEDLRRRRAPLTGGLLRLTVGPAPVRAGVGAP